MMNSDDLDLNLPRTIQGNDRHEQRLRILISGGGTGGHIYPALAVAHVLHERFNAQILYIGDIDGLETRLVPQAGFELKTIHAGRLLRFMSRQTLRDLVRVPRGFIEARRIVRDFQPHAAFTSGGYVAVPGGIAARRIGAPLLIHQQDVPPNLANRLLRPSASQISISFEDSSAYFPKSKTRLMGNPVREAITNQAGTDVRVHKRALGFSPAFPLLVVTGGSQGARHINETVVAALPFLLERSQVLHVSGQCTYEATKATAQKQIHSLPEHVIARYRIEPYLNAEMPIALAAADVVIARAGAATLAELAILGKPSILVPLPPGFSGSPQAVNAAMFATHGAAQVMLDRDLTGEALCTAVQALFANPDMCVRMAAAARGFARPNAASDIAHAVVTLAQAYAEERKQRSVMQAVEKASR